METTIQKIVTGKLMEQIFENNRFVRHYTVSSKVDATNYDGLKKYRKYIKNTEI